MGMLMDRRRALMSVQSGERILTGVVTVETGNKITIPATAADNFIITNNMESGTTMTTGEIVELFRINALTNRVYRSRNPNTAVNPPNLDCGLLQAGSVNQQADFVTLTCSYPNTTGIAVVGSEYRYFIW